MINVNMAGKIPNGITQNIVNKTVRLAFKLARRPERGNVGVKFADDKEITELNRRYLKKNRPTDVLSFKLEDSLDIKAIDHGDIVIAPAYAKGSADRRGISLQEEIIRLIAHGTLHLLGFDHADDATEAKMFELQEKVVEKVI